MRNRTLLALVALAAMALASMPARSAEFDHLVNLRAGEFRPGALAATAGQTARFRNDGTQRHSLRSYSPGAEGEQFSKDFGLPGAPNYETFDYAFPGGEVKFRCTLHSTLSDGNCRGMCGLLTATPPADLPGAPSIGRPASGEVVGSQEVNASGTASAGSARVRVVEARRVQRGETVETVYTDLALVDVVNGAWSARLGLGNGPHILAAYAIHPQGFYSALSPEVTFTVDAGDTRPPSIIVTNPNQLAQLNPVKVSGRALDDVAVKTVRVEVLDKLTPGAERRALEVRCTGCGTNDAQFYAESALPTGQYDIIVTAIDGSGRDPAGHPSDRTTTTRSVIVVL